MRYRPPCIEVSTRRPELRRHHAIHGGAAIKNLARICLLFIAGLPLEPSCLPRSTKQPAEQEQLQLGVRLYNYARISDHEVRAAERVVARALGNSGIQLKWTRCLGDDGTTASFPSPCDLSARASDLVLYFVGSLKELFKPADYNTLGFSIIPRGNEPATMAYISYPRIQRLSSETSVNVAELLGLAAAHEIGHLLLGSRNHADQGIMRANWQLQDIERRGWKLNFTRDQLQQLRASVQTRLRLDGPKDDHPQEAGPLPGSRWTDQPHTRYPLCR